MKDRFLTLTPAILGIEDVNLKADANTDYDTGIIDMRGIKSLTISVEVDNTGGGSAGTASIRCQRYDETDAALGDELDIATAIDTHTADVNALVSLSETLAGEATGATIGSADRHLFPFGRCTFTLRVTEACDGTTCTGSMWIVAST